MNSINFATGSWPDLISQIQGANNEAVLKGKKYIFFYVCANWSVLCRKIETEVLSDKLVGDFFNANFLSIKVHIANLLDSDTPQKLKDFLKVELETYPHILFLNKEGKVIHQASGDFSPNDLINEAKTALSYKFNWI